MLNYQYNNLDKATSPYLQQHKDNPINWQEWSQEVLDYAKKNKKIIFVSIGYSACHWCHIMAKESFSNQEIAEFLNRHFVSIKVDREQRPDIDQYCMSFIQEQSGQGGWPLNVFMTLEVKPFFAVTYLPPLISRGGSSSFLDLIKQLKNWFDENNNNNNKLQNQEVKTEISNFTPRTTIFESVTEQELLDFLKQSFIPYTSSFSDGMQFPPHNTLLFLLYYYELKKDRELLSIILAILDIMAQRGLHDHLQGGFYRYCVDAQWRIPHFEKMLYDQAMLLWIYSCAYKITKKEAYKIVAQKIMHCLEYSFYENGLYHASHDADTNHEEGSTYLWLQEELKKALTETEFALFSQLYEITTRGNFEGKNHLIKNSLSFLPEIENKLLNLRKKRGQPFVDKKKITSWNALLGIAFLMASRYLNNSTAKAKAELIFKNLWERHYLDGKVKRSSLESKNPHSKLWGIQKGFLLLKIGRSKLRGINQFLLNKVQEGEFLEDHASLLLLAAYLSEEDEKYIHKVKKLYPSILKFKKDCWVESINEDFPIVQASIFDHPLPSSSSLAEMAVLKSKIILGEEYNKIEYRQALNGDYFNLMALLSNGLFHIEDFE